MRRGDQGGRVRKLQRALVAGGFELPRFGADGDFGGETCAALDQWCEAQGRLLSLSCVGAELPEELVNAVLGVVEGCDVSGYQKRENCDWPAAWDAGCRFVIVKISEGGTPTSSARAHVEQLRDETPGMLLAGYHYGRLSRDPVQQAEIAQDYAAGLDVRLALDLEDWASDHWVSLLMPRWVARGGDPEDTKALKQWGASWMIEQSCAWTNSFVAACDRPPILYVQPSFFRYRLGKSDAYKACPLWHAGGWDEEDLPGSEDRPDDMTPPWDRVSFWQTHGNRGRRDWYRDGIGAIDRNVFIGTADELAAVLELE